MSIKIVEISVKIFNILKSSYKATMEKIRQLFLPANHAILKGTNLLNSTNCATS
jgi:hypothetical protein